MRMDDSIMTYDDNGEPVLLSDDVRFRIRKSADTVIRVEVRKEANGPTVLEARSTAKDILYEYKLKGNTLILNDYLTTIGKSTFKDQNVRVNIYVPVGMVLQYSSDSGRNFAIRADKDADVRGIEGYLWEMGKDGELKCQDCPEKSFDYENEDSENRIRVNGDGIDININDEDGESFKMKINEDGVDIKAKDENEDNENVDIKIDSDGVKVKTNNNL